MIKWKMAEVMFIRGVGCTALGLKLGMKVQNVYSLKRRKTLPRISQQRISDICVALDCQLWDLMELCPDQAKDLTA